MTAVPLPMPPALLDPLTGLPNRRALDTWCQRTDAAPSQGVMGLLDLDHFKHVNDRWGHEAGDTVLITMSQRLVAAVPPHAFLARLGGDEWVIVVPGMDLPTAKVFFHRLLDHVRQPLHLPDGSICVASASVGVAPLGTGPWWDALRDADAAMYAAKARGRDGAVIFDEDTRKIVGRRRELAAAVSELQARNRALREQARTDALTGLRNRLALDELLDVQVGPEGSPWSHAAMVFADIDHFGDYNHRHGDSAGDETLRRVAEALKSCARDSDVVFRKGGEEFVVLLDDIRPECAAAAAERLRQSVAALALPHAGSPTSPVVSVTVGVATGEPGCRIRDLMEAASAQVMAAKLHGTRNHVFAVHLSAG